MANLKEKTIKGLIWSGIDSYGAFLLKFVFSILIARLLNPEDYGLLGMMAIFIALGKMLTDSGFQSALLQKKEPTKLDYSSVFILQFLLTAVVYVILFFGAKFIADFYNEPRMELIAKVTGLTLVFTALGSIHQTWYIKNMRFKTLTKFNLISSFISGVVGVGMAYTGFGVWALIFQTLAGNIFKVVAFWFFSRLKLGFIYSISSIKKMYSFGWKMFMQDFLNTIFTNLYYPIIGRYFNATELGFYTNAKRFQQLTVMQTNGMISQVLFPAFSSIQDDINKLKEAEIRSFRLLLFIVYPAIAILIITAHPFVNFFLTSKWLPAVPMIRILYLFGLIWPFILINRMALNAIGKSGLTLNLAIINNTLIAAGIFIGIDFGVIGLITVTMIASIIIYFVAAYFNGRHTGFGLKIQVTDILPVLLITGASFFITSLISDLINVHDLLLIIIQIVSLVIIYLLLMKLVKPKSYSHFKLFIGPHLPNKLKVLI